MSGNEKEKAGGGECSRPEQILFREPEDTPAARVPVPARRPEEMPSPCRTAPSPGQQRVLTFAELGGLAERCGARHHLDDIERSFWDKVNEVNRLQNTIVSNQYEIERFHGMVETSALNLKTLEKAVADQHCQLLNIEHFIDNLPEPLPTFPGLNKLCMDNTCAKWSRYLI
ncbi:uncharacterized protein LOC134529040 isoform X2 [Bacillus rossius redtenbacheri]|uniref:uncharacterized protein LOC134529040 isoform X2 n=1 Tax=Bacillus rossius redtenbacheri TaxID=93214 RepID=UPI002FDD5D99